MASGPVVTFNPRPKQDKGLAQAMMMESIGKGIAGLGNAVNQSIAAYQGVKAQQQNKELTAINAAGALVGGLDRLPIETRNKIPGILGVDLPRDETGNVVITPSARTVIERATAKAVEANPQAAGEILGGLREKPPSLEEIALKRDAIKATQQGDFLSAQTKLAETEAEQVGKDADRAQREAESVRENLTKRETAGASAAVKAAQEDAPSDMLVDKKTGNVLPKSVAESNLKPGETLDDYWNPSNKALKQYTDVRKTRLQEEKQKSQLKKDKATLELTKARVQELATKKPANMKAIGEGLIKADKMIEDKTPGGLEAKHYWTQQLITEMGMTAPPQEYPGHMNFLTGAVQQAKDIYIYNNGPPATPEAAPAAPGSKAVAKAVATKQGKVAPTQAPDAELEALMGQYGAP